MKRPSPLDVSLQEPQTILDSLADRREVVGSKEWTDAQFCDAWFSVSESYAQGTYELHVHLVVESLDWCVVLDKAIGGSDERLRNGHSNLVGVGEHPADAANIPDDQTPVLVGCVEPLQKRKDVVVCVFPRFESLRVRLRPLNECLRFREHMARRIGEDFPIGWTSLDITSCAVCSPPRVIHIDGEVDQFVASVRRIEGDGEVVQGATQVEQEISDKKRPSFVGFSSEGDPVNAFPWAFVALDPAADRVFAWGAKGLEPSVEFIEVFLCPVELDPPSAVGMLTLTHWSYPVALEGDAKAQRQRADTGDAAQEGAASGDSHSDARGRLP